MELIAVLALIAALLLLTAWRSNAGSRRVKAALGAEAKAERLLRRNGFRILARQVAKRFAIQVDGDDHMVELRADLLCSRGGRRYIAEVKTGKQAPDISTTSTRRQLLEYRMAYDVDGVLLVDMQNKRIQRIRFPLPAPRRWPWLLAGLIAGALLLQAFR